MSHVTSHVSLKKKLSDNYVAVLSDKYAAVLSKKYQAGISDKYVTGLSDGRRPKNPLFSALLFLTIIEPKSLFLKPISSHYFSPN